MAGEFGYAGKILKVDLSSLSTSYVPTANYTDRFVGGHGLAGKLYWDMVPAEAKASDPENCLIAATGPVCGFPGFAGGRWKLDHSRAVTSVMLNSASSPRW